MRDIRTSLAVALPAAIAVVAVLWILRRKSGKKDGKPNDKGNSIQKAKDGSLSNRDNKVLEQKHSLPAEKEGITITQRKIPETQARDRGASDLSQNAPDGTAGIQSLKATTSESMAICNSGSHNSGRGNLSQPVNDIVCEMMVQSKVEGSSLVYSDDHPVEAGSEVLEEAVSESLTSLSSFEPGSSESVDRVLACERLLPPEKVVTCSSMGRVGFDVGTDKAGSEVTETANSEVAVRPASKTIDVSQSMGIESESAAEAEGQSSPCQKASVFPSSSPNSPSTTTHLSSASPVNTPSKAPGQQRDLSETLSNDITSENSNSKVASSDASPSLSQAIEQQVQQPNSCVAAGQTSVRAKTQSQSSLSSEDIDSLWGIKMSHKATANWDKQLSLDDPSSPKPVLPSSSTTTTGSEPCSVPSETDNEPVPDKDSSNIPHSPVCDSNSEGSNDSGRGGSEQDSVLPAKAFVQFDFNMPSDLCGRFIGRQGKNINFVKSKTGASISLSNNPFSAEYQVCHVSGTQSEVDNALSMIRRKFPLREFPLLTMVPINVSPLASDPSQQQTQQQQQHVIVPDIMQLSLPEGVSVEVYVSAIVDAGHVFVQQPTHRSFMSLEKLTYSLNTVYGENLNVPAVPTPIECGVICVVESEGCWYRAMIMSPEDGAGEAQVKFVDYGGYASMPVSALKQIRTDFMTLPFQAVECFMANITPLQDEDYFSAEATNALSEMTNYKLLQCQVVARSETGTPYIHLYQINPDMHSAVFINRALVNNQQARWVEIL